MIEGIEKIEPSASQRLFARNWPAKTWQIVVTASFVALVTGYFKNFTSLELMSLRFIVVAALSLSCGWLTALLSGWLVLGPLYYRPSSAKTRAISETLLTVTAWTSEKRIGDFRMIC